MLAFKFFWYASNELLTESNISDTPLHASLIDSNALLVSPNISSSHPIPFLSVLLKPPPANITPKPPSMVLKLIVPNALPIPSIIGDKPFPMFPKNLPIEPNILPKSILPIDLTKLDIAFPTPSITLPTPENPLLIISAALPNTLLLSIASAILDTKFPIPDVTERAIFPIPPNTLPSGDNALNTAPTALPTVLNTENTPLNVFFIFPAVSSLTLSFSVKSLKPLDKSANFLPVIGGNTSLNAFPTDPNTFPRLPNILLKPFMISSLPPNSFHCFNISFLALADLPTTFSNALDIPVHSLVDSSEPPNKCSNV